MVKFQSSKLAMRVRFPLPAHLIGAEVVMTHFWFWRVPSGNKLGEISRRSSMSKSRSSFLAHQVRGIFNTRNYPIEHSPKFVNVIGTPPSRRSGDTGRQVVSRRAQRRILMSNSALYPNEIHQPIRFVRRPWKRTSGPPQEAYGPTIPDLLNQF